VIEWLIGGLLVGLVVASVALRIHGEYWPWWQTETTAIMTEAGFWKLKERGVRTWGECRADSKGFVRVCMTKADWRKHGTHLARYLEER